MIIKHIIQNQGKKLGFLIAALNAPYDVKLAWIDLLPHMSLSQIDRLINILESRYLDQKIQDADQQFKQALEEIEDDYKNQAIDIDNKIFAKIEKLAKQIS